MEVKDYFSMMWSDDEDTYSEVFFYELMDMHWRSRDILFDREVVNWNKIDSGKREAIVKGILVMHAIKSSIGGNFLPILIGSLNNKYVTKVATISAMEARLTGQHAIIASRILKELNTKSLVDKCIKDIENTPGIINSIEIIEARFDAVVGWTAAYRMDQEIDNIKVFDQLNKHIWQAVSIAILMLEVSDSLPIALLFSEFCNYDLPEMKKVFQIMLKDKTHITNYLSSLARTKYSLLPNDMREEVKQWLVDTATLLFREMWSSSLKETGLTDLEKLRVQEYARYSVNKGMFRLGLEGIFPKIDMPQYIEQGLDIKNININIKRPAWWSWKGGK